MKISVQPMVLASHLKPKTAILRPEINEIVAKDTLILTSNVRFQKAIKPPVLSLAGLLGLKFWNKND